MVLAARIAVAACWGAFAVTWAIGTVLEKRCAPSVIRRRLDLATWAAVAAGAATAALPPSTWRSLSYGPQWIRAVGIVVVAVGTAGTIWARLTLGLMWSSRVVVRRDHVLRTTGPYGITRHPIYTGLVTMFAGTMLALGFGRWTVLLVVVAAALWAKARSEEQLLRNAFSRQYEAYAERVPMLLPLRVRRRAPQR